MVRITDAFKPSPRKIVIRTCYGHATLTRTYEIQEAFSHMDIADLGLFSKDVSSNDLRIWLNGRLAKMEPSDFNGYKEKS